MNAQRRDANEAGIIAALRAAGAFVQQMDKSAGFDLLVFFQGAIYVMEVKIPGKQNNLTLAEEDRMEMIRVIGEVDYNIVTTPEAALNVIGR